MKKHMRTVGEMLLLGVLAGVLLIAVILIVRQLFDDEKAQYFVIGYYVAMHNDLARWIWKRLGIGADEKIHDTASDHGSHDERALAEGRARQKLKLAAIEYGHAKLNETQQEKR